MKKTIQSFVNSGKIAIAGASPNKDNFGKSLMNELEKIGKEVYPVNPKYDQIERKVTFPTIRDLPSGVESLILAVAPEVCEEIVDQCIGTGIKRVWMVRGVGKGAYSEKAHATCIENNIEVVYGFCPMMFFGNGMHSLHLWLRKSFGNIPAEFELSAP